MTMDHVLPADEPEGMVLDANHIEWTRNLTEFFNHKHEAAIQKGIQQL